MDFSTFETGEQYVVKLSDILRVNLSSDDIYIFITVVKTKMVKKNSITIAVKQKPKLNYNDNNSFYESMKFPIKLAQCFSYFPINGINGNNYTMLNFRWDSWRFFYAFSTFLGCLFCFFCVLRKVLLISSDLYEMNGLVFEFAATIACIIVFKLSVDWPLIVKEWTHTERCFKTDEFPGNLRRQLKMIVISIMTPAAIEHILVNCYKLKSSFELMPNTYEAFKHYFVVTSYSHVFLLFTYHPILGILLQKTFSWNFTDVIIMLISTALALRLKQLRRRIKSVVQLKIDDIYVWRKIREDYNRIQKLCFLMNDKIALLVILSFTANLYFILVQLFSSLRPINSPLERAYFYMSFGLLILRIICVCLFGGRIYDENKNIIPLLNSVHPNAYNDEIERFIYHLAASEMVLTGKNFFNITRGLILKIAGAIVTYELVLIQFHGEI